ncbi:type II secretion system protein GspM [Pseudoduganella chitinolytica]|uniref:Type II secretion system protein GspM n=1 Tax=Pseudoduganella chitinolytica TaxID=34070 RepID=A0ABY8BHD6_9BURK|nr:type II secretion system protein GspM [Pseudoduganella chitinolytica]WEF34778.1 type II secretion system protein GspM [Pseudoduganella chitinolytica]
MKDQWLKWAAKIDALSVRERVLIALGGVAAIVFVVYFGVTDPANVRERSLRAAITQQRGRLAAIDVEITQKMAAAQADPDAAARQRIVALATENGTLRASLRSTQKALVPPARMSALLQQMVQQNSRLKLVSLKTLPPAGTADGNFADTPVDPTGPVLPVTSLTTTPPGAAPTPAPPTPMAPAGDDNARPLLYRHGVQVVLRGAYGDMVSYMEALERMPAQVFWGKAVLDATEHDKATLTLTLYTLSLDEKWLAL